MKILTLIGITLISVTVFAQHKIAYQPQHYKFIAKGMQAEDGNSYPTLEPYMAFGLGVVQLEGAKLKDKDIVTCIPKPIRDEQGMHIEMDCDNGVKLGVIAVSFPAKGRQ